MAFWFKSRHSPSYRVSSVASDSEKARPAGPAWSVHLSLCALDSKYFTWHEHFGARRGPFRPPVTPSTNRNVSKAFPVLAEPSGIWNNLFHFSVSCFSVALSCIAVLLTSDSSQASAPASPKESDFFVFPRKSWPECFGHLSSSNVPFPLFSVSLWEVGHCLWPPGEVRKNGLNYHAVSICYWDLDVGSCMSRARTSPRDIKMEGSILLGLTTY